MTRKEVAEMIASTNLEYAYRFFPIGNAPESPPYILYFYEDSDDMMADNQNYTNIENLVIELYLTDERTFEEEDTLDAILIQNQQTYSKTEEYIEDTNMYRITYETEVVIHGE